jgi:hypothetical protein
MQGQVTKRKPRNRGITKEDKLQYDIQMGHAKKLASGQTIEAARKEHLERQAKFEAKLEKQTIKQSPELKEEVAKESPLAESPTAAKMETAKEAPKKK